MTYRKLQYPGLDRIEDPGIRSAMQLIWDDIHILNEREEVAEGLTSAELSQVRTALQATGSHPLSIRGLKGESLGTQKTPMRYYGIWTSSTDAAASSYPWDVEKANTSKISLVRSNSDLNIVIKTAGTYLVLAHLTTNGADPVVTLIHSGTTVSTGYGEDVGAGEKWSHLLVAVVSAVPGDYIEAAVASAAREGGTGMESVLIIVRIL